ncbi:Holliday junction resolvase RecU [uncultured Dubosiella sp.]|uniref:Holliday junction resolvase RecU n=1 Tax=uncultured Dubosiella sp. TaxID=1937011 RepID=UPI000ECDFD11|nr:Holliday junction resolvase RecU [uncultured Dubosiella sp.]GJM56989.1 Holliday junction resolvase RecU [Erysipelotrichaceae bacterium OPF54]HAM31560.1 Holliday junction resolvase RecU [Erysipelotrichaceae bacterium]
MSTIQYPNGGGVWHEAKNLDNHSGRGATLEKDINASNTYYRELDIALIYKKPTPIQVVKVDYPRRDRAKIVEAYYRTPSTTDYNGIYKGKYIDFEAKETKNKMRFPLQMIHAHQIKHLQLVQKHGGIGFFIIRFTYYNKTYLVDAGLLIEKISQTTEYAIPYEWFAANGHLIREGLYPRLNYLKVVEAIYFKEEN